MTSPRRVTAVDHGRVGILVRGVLHPDLLTATTPLADDVGVPIRAILRG